MKKLIESLIAGMMVVYTAVPGAAQELLMAPEGMETVGAVPDLALPPGSDDGTSMSSDSDQLPTESWREEFGPHEEGGGHMYLCDVALLESSGTWLRRGYWYAETDAVIYNRKWNRFERTLAFQPTGISLNQFGNFVELRSNRLQVEPHEPGAEGSARLTLGHFLFRDQDNRDHVAEFTIFGGGQWTQQQSLLANPNTELFDNPNIPGNVDPMTLNVPRPISGGNQSFDGATSMNYRYDGRFNSYELNYMVKDRMGRDRLELEPSGHWIRRADTSMSRFFLAGVRFIDISDDFLWSASGIDDPNTAGVEEEGNGSVLTTTDNDLLGTQVGFGCSYETARWSAGVKAKGGVFVNIVDLNNTFSLTEDVGVDPTVQNSSLSTDELSFVGEAALLGKWHLRPNFSLRASLEILFASSNAFATSQFPGIFIPGGPTKIDTGGESTFLGGAIGFEGYW